MLSFLKRSEATVPVLLESKVADLERKLITLETEYRLIRTEWAEIYDKVIHALDRIRKRQLVDPGVTSSVFPANEHPDNLQKVDFSKMSHSELARMARSKRG